MNFTRESQNLVAEAVSALDARANAAAEKRRVIV